MSEVCSGEQTFAQLRTSLKLTYFDSFNLTNFEREQRFHFFYRAELLLLFGEWRLNTFNCRKTKLKADFQHSYLFQATNTDIFTIKQWNDSSVCCFIPPPPPPPPRQSVSARPKVFKSTSLCVLISFSMPALTFVIWYKCHRQLGVTNQFPTFLALFNWGHVNTLNIPKLHQVHWQCWQSRASPLVYVKENPKVKPQALPKGK